jgi:hypothetical protein
MRHILERALAAKRRSRRVELRDRFDAGSDGEWSDLVIDISAFANSGGGVVVFAEGVAVPDASTIVQKVQGLTGTEFADLETAGRAIVVGAARVPIVFRGTLFFRHGGKSKPATTEDIAKLMERRINSLRKSWLTAVKRAVQMPEGFFSESPGATPIRVVEDPRAPAYRMIDYDKTHPYRQKELLAKFRERLPERPINQFDLLAVRHKHNIDERPEFSHKGLYGTRQYSQKFVDWLTEQAATVPLFFETARADYQQRRQKLVSGLEN